MEPELVSVHELNSAVTAEIIKNALEAEGIRCFIEGENQAAFAGVIPISILVPADQAERARELIAKHEAAHDTVDELEGDDDGDGDDTQLP